MILSSLLATASVASAAVCPRGFLVHPAANPSYCLSSPGADRLHAETGYTIGVLVEPCRPNVRHQQWRWKREVKESDGRSTVLLQNLAAADIPGEEDDSPSYSFCVTSGYFIGNDWNGNPSRFGAGSALMMDVCRWDSDIPSTDPGQSWQQRGDQIVGNPIIDGNGEQKEQCLDVRSGDLDKGVVQMWYCVDSNTNQKWVFEPL